MATDGFLTEVLSPAPRAVDARSLALIAEEDRIAFYEATRRQLLPIPESSEFNVAAPTLFPPSSPPGACAPPPHDDVRPSGRIKIAVTAVE